jgi:hypothetical protein
MPFRSLTLDEQRLMYQLLQQSVRQNGDLLHHILDVKSILQLQRSIPQQVELQRPVTLLDAYGRIAPFHLEFINSVEVRVVAAMGGELMSLLHAGFYRCSQGSLQGYWP